MKISHQGQKLEWGGEGGTINFLWIKKNVNRFFVCVGTLFSCVLLCIYFLVEAPDNNVLNIFNLFNITFRENIEPEIISYFYYPPPLTPVVGGYCWWKIDILIYIVDWCKHRGKDHYPGFNWSWNSSDHLEAVYSCWFHGWNTKNIFFFA